MSAVGCCDRCHGMGKMDIEVIRHFSTVHSKTLHYCNWACLKDDLLYGDVDA
jgi:hypothetical protein